MTDVTFIPNIDQYYKQFSDYTKPLWDTRFITSKIPILKRDLEKIGVTLYYSIWNEWAFKAGIFETEYFHEDFIPIDKTNYIIISEKRLYLDSTKKEGIVYIHANIDSNKIEEFNKIFIAHFPNRTKGLKSTNVISINIKPENVQVNNIMLNSDRSYINSHNTNYNTNYNTIHRRMNIVSKSRKTSRSKRRNTSSSKRRNTSRSKRRNTRKNSRSKRRKNKRQNTRRRKS
jgi:hypothetical protein